VISLLPAGKMIGSKNCWFLPDSGVVSVVAVYADGSVIEMAT
jgi:hypothetical protein